MKGVPCTPPKPHLRVHTCAPPRPARRDRDHPASHCPCSQGASMSRCGCSRHRGKAAGKCGKIERPPGRRLAVVRVVHVEPDRPIRRSGFSLVRRARRHGCGGRRAAGHPFPGGSSGTFLSHGAQSSSFNIPHSSFVKSLPSSSRPSGIRTPATPARKA